MLKRIRAVWADDDNVRDFPRQDFAILPSIVVETSPGKFHYYWLTTTDNIDEWGYVMNGIAITYSTDANAKDLVRVLRVPGFLHHKHEAFRSRTYINSPDPYSWDEIVKAFPPNHNVVLNTDETSSSSTHKNAQFAGFAQARESILTGANFHGAIMWLLNHWVNCGIKSPEELMVMVTDLMHQSVIQDGRWDARMREEYLAANIRDAIAFVKDHPVNADINVPDLADVENQQLDVGYPPGLMGQLCQEIFEMAPHPNEEVAIMAGFSLVAGITGRTFNVLGTGLNLYVALLADSGIGKANLKNSINTALLQNCIMEGGPTFKGASRFTGPKPMFEMLLNGLSRVCVLEESGLMSESTAGDQKGLTRVMLDIYSSSGRGEFAGGESYSRAEDTVPVIPSPALTIAHVSTPLSYLRALKSKDATVSGDIARVWMMRSMRYKRPLNIERREDFSSEVMTQIRRLVKRCAPQQSKDSHTVINVGTTCIDIQADSNKWTDFENRCKDDGDQLRRALTSRAFVKILKIASIASIFNGNTEVGIHEYKWAQSAIEGEIATIEEALSFGSSDDMMLVVKNIIVPVVSKILNDKYKDRAKCVPRSLRGKGIFTASNINQALRNSEVLKRMNDDPERSNPKSGIEKIIGFMLRSGLVVAMSQDQLRMMGAKTKIAYKVTEDFVLLMEQ
jgi:hypothetical protein